MERRIERALVDLEDVARDLLDALGDAPAVHCLEGQCLEDEHVERPLQDVGVVRRHAFSCRVSTGEWDRSCRNVKRSREREPGTGN